MTGETASTGAMRILLLSAYDAPSHRYWRQGLERYCVEDRFTQLALPPRFFSWRIRGNSLSWGLGARETLLQDYDLLVATSQVDLCSLRGFLPELGLLPTMVYCHENQFAYPQRHSAHGSLEPQIVNLYSALCADSLVFNSCWNRDSFLEGVSRLLRRLPDHVPPGLPDSLAARSRVLAVPIETVKTTARPPGSPLDVVWNHRWEYDKGPAILLAAVKACVERKLPVRFHIVGQQFRQQPPEFQQLSALLADNPDLAGQWGYVEERARYLQLLESADVVLSTALHEFQGLAVMEAVARGCAPLVPDRLSYPEFFPTSYRYPSSPGDALAEGDAIAACLARMVGGACSGDWSKPPDLQAYSWQRLGPRYRELMRRCVTGGGGAGGLR